MLAGETPPSDGGDGELDHVTPLARLYPDTELAEIPDPLKWRDSKSYDKCYWLVYKCVRWDGRSQVADCVHILLQGVGEEAEG